jgi:2-keto-3-deoxy-L-rhamnonate aldolase RhmA
MGLSFRDTGPGTEHEAAILEVLKAVKKVGKAAGKHCGSAGEVTERIGQGFQFLALSSDAGFLSKAAREAFDGIDWTGGADAAEKGSADLY